MFLMYCILEMMELLVVLDMMQNLTYWYVSAETLISKEHEVELALIW
jgi:hypothetical protein